MRFSGLRQRISATTAPKNFKGFGKSVLHRVRLQTGTRFEKRDYSAELETLLQDPNEIAERRRNAQEATENYRGNVERLRMLRQDLTANSGKPRRARPSPAADPHKEASTSAPTATRDAGETHLARAKRKAAKGDWQVTPYPRLWLAVTARSWRAGAVSLYLLHTMHALSTT